MKIRRKDREDMEDTHTLLSQAITEDIAKWLSQWQQSPVGFETKADIYHVVRERFKNGIEI